MESRGVSSMEQIRVGVISARGQNKVFLAEIGVILKKKFLLQLLHVMIIIVVYLIL